jgi:hypothetical protein
MTIDEAIEQIEEVVEENQKVVDMHRITCNGTGAGVLIDELFADDTEIIEEHLANFQKTADQYRQLAEWLKELKQLREQTRWIPVSESMPKQNEHVGNVDKHYLIQDEFGDMQVAAYTNRGWIPIHTIGAFEYDVVAWQPLPMSYEEEKE